MDDIRIDSVYHTQIKDYLLVVGLKYLDFFKKKFICPKIKASF